MANKDKTPPAGLQADPLLPDGSPAEEGAAQTSGGKDAKASKGAKKAKETKTPKGAKASKSTKGGAQGKKGKKGSQKRIRFTRRSFLLKLFMRIAIFFIALSRHLKVEKVRMRGLKPPFLILCTHQSFTDYAVVERVAAPFDVNHICEVSEFVDSESLMNNLGCIPLRRFVADSKLLFHLRETLVQNKVAAIYPEAHFSFDGMDSPLPDTLFKLIKTLRVPVVVVKVRGTYVSHPCWSMLDHKTPLEAVVTQVLSANDVKVADEDTIKSRVLTAFHYDDLWWQLQNNIHITSPRRAEGLENILYLCPMCKQEYDMHSQGTTIYCGSCHQAWTLSSSFNLSPVEGSMHQDVLENIREQQKAELQNAEDKKRLKAATSEYAVIVRRHEMLCSEYEREMAERQRLLDDAQLYLTAAPVFDSEPPVDPGPPPEFVPPPPAHITLPPPEPPPDISRISHWFDFQRETLVSLLQSGAYLLEIPVQVELLENISRGFIPLGEGLLCHSAGGFQLTYKDHLSGRKATIAKTPLTTYSCHVDFDYNGKGPFIDISTADQTFYLYPQDARCSVVKIALATEELCKMAQAIMQQKNN